VRRSFRSLARAAALALAVSAAGCTPDVATDGVPDAMEFDTDTTPPRVPQPTGLIVNPATGHIDFALAGTPLPADCQEASASSPAECHFDRYLETLDGFPTVTPAAAPATAELDPSTLTVGENVFAIALGASDEPVAVAAGFDEATRSLVVRPTPTWSLGETYFLAVRGYAAGVRTRAGGEVVGSPTMALLKAEASLTCGASAPNEIDAHCPSLSLLAQSQPEAVARASLVTLETARAAYAAAGVWDRFEAVGLPKAEIAVLWGFPIHTSSVAEVDPSVGLVPEVVAPDELRIAVHGPVDASTVQAFIVREQPGSVVLMDLTEAAAGDLVAGFPRVDVEFTDGALRIAGSEPFEPGHQYGVFVTNLVRAPDGAPLVPSPISVLLTSPTPVADGEGRSLVSTVPDADAALLEAGRAELAELLDNPVFAPLTGVTRDSLVYTFAFTFPGAP
jgi:hypothetical protein